MLDGGSQVKEEKKKREKNPLFTFVEFSGRSFPSNYPGLKDFRVLRIANGHITERQVFFRCHSSIPRGSRDSINEVTVKLMTESLNFYIYSGISVSIFASAR